MSNKINGYEKVSKYFDTLIEKHKDNQDKWLYIACELKNALGDVICQMNEFSRVMDKFEQDWI